MIFNNLDEYYQYLENDTNFQYLDLNAYKYITALRDKVEDKNIKNYVRMSCFLLTFLLKKVNIFQNSNLDERVLESYLKLLVLLSQKLKISPNEFHEKLDDYHISQLEPKERKKERKKVRDSHRK